VASSKRTWEKAKSLGERGTESLRRAPARAHAEASLLKKKGREKKWGGDKTSVWGNQDADDQLRRQGKKGAFSHSKTVGTTDGKKEITKKRGIWAPAKVQKNPTGTFDKKGGAFVLNVVQHDQTGIGESAGQERGDRHWP